MSKETKDIKTAINIIGASCTINCSFMAAASLIFGSLSLSYLLTVIALFMPVIWYVGRKILAQSFLKGAVNETGHS